MNTALTVRNDMDVMSLGQVFVQSGFFSDSKQAAQAVVKILAGQELGFGPIASMTGVYIVKGKVSLSANLMAAAIKRSGKYNYRVEDHTDRVCTIRFLEGGEVVGVSTFTIEEASKAGLTSNPTWKNFPKNMLFARALSNGAKWFCPDIFGGPVYTPDELGAYVDEDGEVIHDAAPEPQPVIVDQPTDAEPEPHWTQNPALVRKTEQWLAKKGIEDRDANAALGLDDWRTTDLDKKSFADAVLAYVDEQARAAEASGEDTADTFADAPAAELGATVTD